MRKTGTYQAFGSLNHFIPNPLPPTNPPLELSPQLMTLCNQACFELGKLNEMSLKLPDPARFIKAYVIKEALLSSSIEGIHTTLADVFTHQLEEPPTKANKETQLVLNYTHALESALAMLNQENLPLSNRIILHAHEALMSTGEGDKANPGILRKQSVRLGQLIPPPAPTVPQLMSDLERYINEPSEIPSLINAGLVHVQFETIHPFLDGNGRIGRLLIVLMLINSGLLTLPILYPSYFFKKHQALYYQKLDSVRQTGDFEGWISYYVTAIRDSAIDGYKRAKAIEELEVQLTRLITSHPILSKTKETSNLVIDHLFRQPVATVTSMSKQLNKAYNTINNQLQELIKLEMIREVTLGQRNKLYRFEPYLRILEQEY